MKYLYVIYQQRFTGVLDRACLIKDISFLFTHSMCLRIARNQKAVCAYNLQSFVKHLGLKIPIVTISIMSVLRSNCVICRPPALFILLSFLQLWETEELWHFSLIVTFPTWIYTCEHTQKHMFMTICTQVVQMKKISKRFAILIMLPF